MININTIIFDLGNVLIDWNPNRLYKKIFRDADERIHFLSNICSHDWNVQQDAGRSLSEATQLLVRQHPYYEAEIRAFYGRWQEMLNGSIPGSVELLKVLKRNKQLRLYALTNWSAETFPYAIETFDFLQLFEGILVSGTEKLIKPDSAIYQLLLKRYQIKAEQAFFIDDSLKNVEAATALGIHAHHFTSAEKLGAELIDLGLVQPDWIQSPYSQ